MIRTSIFKIDYHQISRAIESFIYESRWGDSPDYIIMSKQTLTLIESKSIMTTEATDGDSFFRGIPIAIDNTLKIGEVRVV